MHKAKHWDLVAVTILSFSGVYILNFSLPATFVPLSVYRSERKSLQRFCGICQVFTNLQKMSVWRNKEREGNTETVCWSLTKGRDWWEDAVAHAPNELYQFQWHSRMHSWHTTACTKICVKLQWLCMLARGQVSVWLPAHICCFMESTCSNFRKITQVIVD